MDKKTLQALQDEVKKDVNNTRDLKTLESLRVKYLGKKGTVTSLLKELKDVPGDQRAHVGKLLNIIKQETAALIKEKEDKLKKNSMGNKVKEESVDITLPGRSLGTGKLHILTQVLEQIKDIFIRMGFAVSEGPEIETDYYNFEALNMKPDHPARDMWSTLYINTSDNTLLRTHTSPVQIRVMEKQEPPVRIIAPGKVYRHDLDISHAPMFHQVEGLWVDKNVSFSDLKGTLSLFLKQMFASDIGIRFRPSFFPFTEPSVEVDIGCVICKGQGCRVCKGTGWLEILGAGMVNPNVLKNVGYDPEEFVGYAFGMGVERIAMLSCGIDDIRLFFENDLRFLKQF
ncbi:MAG: phenylalanine--tRNA ligase subunit alpha [bacterium]